MSFQVMNFEKILTIYAAKYRINCLEKVKSSSSTILCAIWGGGNVHTVIFSSMFHQF
jgi:hypothetical protein